MKKYLLTFALSMMSLTAFAQTDYETIMSERITKLEACKSLDDFQILANDFDRIGRKETKQWQPSYYAAFAYIQKGRMLMREGKMTELSTQANSAEKYLEQAEAIAGKDNSEIHLLKKMAFSLKMMENPAERYMTDGMKAMEELKKAESLDPSNPRVALIKAEDTYFTPEQYGGSKTKGLEQFKTALEKFNAFKPKTAVDPNWGKAEAEYFLSQTSSK
ncbi:tetratricopeptide repeat protein [Chryseobacterium ginsengisoli]|uniref:Tetratricopeptide repeat protein n=1 Tax=Chryseobacterium ginsengisoli TaxID=363853 RepID=A0ABP9M9N6_9FLAO